MELERIILIITGLSTFVLAVLTGFYAYFTRKLVKSSNEANQQNQQAIRDQIRVLTAPFLRCGVNRQNNNLYLKLSNIGNAPAYDIDLFVIGNYFGEEEDINQFSVKEPKRKTIKPQLDEEGFFHLFDRIVYGYAFPKSEVNAEFQFPKIPGSVKLLLQYRNMSGENYAQLYWFFESTSKPERYYKLGACDPVVVQISPRISFDLENESYQYKLVIENGEEIPPMLRNSQGYKEFCDEFVLSVSTGHYGRRFDIEDRGEWKNI